MPDQKTVDVILGYKVDRASQQQVVAATKAVKAEIADLAPVTKAAVTGVRTGFDLLKSGQKDLARDLGDMKRDYATLGDSGSVAFKELQASMRQTANANDDLVASLREEIALTDQLTEAQKRQRAALLGTPSKGGGFSQGAGNLGSFSSAVGGLNVLGGGGAVFQEVGQLGDIVQYLPSAAAGIGALGAGAVVAAPALLAAGSALAIYNDLLEKSRQKTEAFAAGLVEAFTAGTTGAIQELVKQKENDIKVLQATADVLDRQLADAPDALAQGLDNTSNQITNFLNRTAEQVGGATMPELEILDEQTRQSLQEELDQTNVEICKAQASLEAYNLVMGENQTALADAAQVQQGVVDTAGAITDRFRDFIPVGLEWIGIVAKANDEIERDAENRQKLIDSIAEPFAGLGGDILQNLGTTVGDLVLNANAADDALLDLNTGIAKLSDAKNARIGELADKLQDSLADLGEDLSDQQAKQSAGDLEELKKFHQSEEQRVKEHRLRLRDIDSRFDLAENSAVQDRNAVALQDALDSRKAATDSESEKFSLESGKRQQDLENLKENQSAEQRELTSNYQKRYSRLIEQNQREVNATIAKYNADVQVRQQAYNQQQQQLAAALNAELGLREQANNAIVTGLTSMVNSVLSQTARLGDGTPANVVPGGGAVSNVANSLISNLLGFDGGGSAPSNQFVRLNEQGIESGVNSRGDFAIFSRPTRVFTAQQTQQMLGGGGGINISVPVQGAQMTARQVANHARDTVYAALKDAGWGG